ncbi:hypothetical protein CNX65_22695 [Actinosynnema pretiosum]|uniref:Tyr recombinase domain-containing protein n=1 Tax=Actinosynnema pretiosum TaxID=42197 RepID=A0A290Z9Q9_9PSEU|nr:hypothetical protein CNX65_22695 [Actinosynnema pretiosum]
MSGAELEPAGTGRWDGEGGPSLERRLNLWLGKFASAHSRRAYADADADADALGIPHHARHWHPTDERDRAARPRRPLRRGTAFLPWCHAHGLDPLHQVGLEQIQLWPADVAASGLAKRTRAQMLTVVAEFYTALQRQGLPVGNPAALVDTRTTGLRGTATDDDQVDLDADQVRQLLLAARRGTGRGRDLTRERDLAALTLLAVTGARAAEIVGLDLADYRRPDPAGPATLVLHGKGAKARTATLEPAVADEIDAWLRVRAHTTDGALPALPGTPNGGRQPLLTTRTGTRLHVNHLQAILRAVAARPGCPLRGIAHRLHPHALRGAFITIALDAGVPIDQVQAAAGHAHISTTQGYDHRRGRRRTKAFTIVSGLVTDHIDEDEGR